MDGKGGSIRETVEGRVAALKLLGETYNLEKEVKTQRLKDGVAELLAVIEGVEVGKEGISLATLCFWRGAALDFLPESTKDAERELSKAVKLDPSLVDAWNALGNLFWKKGDLKGSKGCFLQAVQQKKNAVSLRCLSMILRATKAETPQERLELVNESVTKAKEAVGLEAKDSESWYVLGNAYTTLFFCSNNDHVILQRALKAYNMAATHQGSQRNPDLYFNRAGVYKFTEDYSLAVADFKQALELDPSFKCAPDIEEIERLVAKLAKTVATKAGLKPRVLKSLTDSLPPLDGTKAKSLCGKRSPVPASSLTEGANEGKAVLMSFVMCVTKDQDTPVSAFAMDASAMVVVSLYNVSPGSFDSLKQGDLMCVLDPTMKTISLGASTYPTLQLSNPSLLVVNGKSLQPTATQVLNRPMP